MKTRRYSLFVLLAGIATFASMIFMIAMSGGEIARPVEYPNKEGFTQAIFWFEMVRSPEEVRSVLGDPGSTEGIRLRHAMDMTNRYDFIFMVCYPLLIASLFLFLDRRLADDGRRLRYGTALVTAGACLSAITMIADAYENTRLFRLSAYTDLSNIDPGVISQLMIATNIKSGAIMIAGLLLVYLYVLYFKKAWGILLPLIYAVSVAFGTLALIAGSMRALIETGATIGMIGWLISTVHGGYWFFKKTS
ncbi:MAG TPA: hypothetical protein PLL11_18400 [Spirochaetota bacterium]|nr:hypothetical protein [Spirochaetota bacterium]